MNSLLGLIIPFIGTALGSAMVFLMRNKLNNKIEKVLLGFASGVMVAASIWSLIIPSIDMAQEQNIISWLPATIGFILGIMFLLILDNIIPHLHIKSKEPEGLKSNLGKSAMMVLAVTLHNIPEGMAVGVALAGAVSGNSTITIAGAIALSIGIAIQNFPEGAIISMPLRAEGNSRWRSFLIGSLSGAVEPIGAVVVLLLASAILPVLPYMLAFAAGAMMYVVVEELIPEASDGQHSNLSTIGFAIGFVLMMVLDVVMG
jgi:ZIP family zinc transporter